MKKFVVQTDSIGGRFGRVFLRDEEVFENQFEPNLTDSLVFRGFLREISSGHPAVPKQNAEPPLVLGLPLSERVGLRMFQIYYDDSQISKLDYTPYKNEDCNFFFEHQVMVDLINSGQHESALYFGVLSHKYREKLVGSKKISIPNIANKSQAEFTPESFYQELMDKQPDVMSLQRHIPHDTISFGNVFHPRMSEFFTKIMNEIGYEWRPTIFDNVFYCNYFAARSDIYEDYVKTMLEPAMDVMRTMPELVTNSGYPKNLPPHLSQKWGINFYPYHTFLCERMFSFYAHIKNLKCLHF